MEAIRNYTAHAYRQINSGLLKGQQPEGAAELAAALSALPAAAGTCFRTIWVDELDAYAAQVKASKALCFPAFTSTSRSEATARRFNGNVLFRIEGRTGRDIARYSDAPAEAETLFTMGTTFVVKSVKAKKIAGRVFSLEISLIEK